MSGARLVVSLLHELRRRGGRYGLATLCIGVAARRFRARCAVRAPLADGRADVDHALVLDRHEGRADAEDDHAFDLVESSLPPLADGDDDADLALRLGVEALVPQASSSRLRSGMRAAWTRTVLVIAVSSLARFEIRNLLLSDPNLPRRRGETTR